jgi:hypothetical protein
LDHREISPGNSIRRRHSSRDPQQLSLLDRLPRGHGGRRQGAGRPRSKQGRVSHEKRPALDGRCPEHITLRRRDGLPCLRDLRNREALVCAIGKLRVRDQPKSARSVKCELYDSDAVGFRVVHYSIQSNHVHLICEASSGECLSMGMRILATAMTRAFNRVHGRRGSLWGDRYHARILRTPKEVRNAIVYVLGNRRRHGGQHQPKQTIDCCTSARWFTAFIEKLPPLPPGIEPPISEARTWLLSVGWRRHGLISVDEGPWNGSS